MEKEARKSQLNGVGHNHSRDSAIDADLQELETETVQVDIVSKGETPRIHSHLVLSLKYIQIS